jgi:DNA-binding response OmpR family regulator
MATSSNMPGILIIEDDEYIRTYLARTLKQDGYAVQSAADAEAALIVLHSSVPQLVLLDLGLLGISGSELLQAIRTHSEWRHIPVIVMTGWIRLPKNIRALAQGYLEKPFTHDELSAAITTLLPAVPLQAKEHGV